MTTPRPATPAPHWIVWLAHVSAWSPVPSSLWRLPLIFGVSMGMSAEMMGSIMDVPWWARAVYLIGLGALSDGLAFLALGLVRPWGEIFPRWIPGLGGKVVPLRTTVALAALGGVGATAFGATLVIGFPAEIDSWNGWALLMAGCYFPLALWGPTLLIVTVDYYRRRTAGLRPARDLASAPICLDR